MTTGESVLNKLPVPARDILALGELTQRIVCPPNADKYSSELGFFPRSVRIDNPSNQWWELPESSILVPPFTIGIMATLINRSQVANIRKVTVAGLSTVPNNANATGSAIFTFCEKAHLPCPGLLVVALLT